MEKEKKRNLHAVRIPCNSTVKKYTFATLKRLGLDAKPGKVYNDIISGNGVISMRLSVVSTKARMLQKMIPLFHPPVPVTAAEKLEYDALIEQWGTLIENKINDAFSFIYLCDEVNKVLKKKKSMVRCQHKHLVWCLSLFGESAMTPKGVADAILKYNGTDWENIPQLENDDKYYVRLNDDSDKEKQKFLDTVEFIYALSPSAADSSLVGKIENDINVLTEFSKWGDNLTDYKYEDRYREFAGRLQTLPAAFSKKYKAVKKKLKSATTVEHTTEDSQHEPEQWELNRIDLTDYINEFTSDDEIGKHRIEEVQQYIDDFCKFKDFETEFYDLKRSVAEYQKGFKGGYIAGIIKNKVMEHESKNNAQNFCI